MHFPRLVFFVCGLDADIPTKNNSLVRNFTNATSILVTTCKCKQQTQLMFATKSTHKMYQTITNRCLFVYFFAKYCFSCCCFCAPRVCFAIEACRRPHEGVPDSESAFCVFAAIHLHSKRFLATRPCLFLFRCYLFVNRCRRRRHCRFHQQVVVQPGPSRGTRPRATHRRNQLDNNRSTRNK